MIFDHNSIEMRAFLDFLCQTRRHFTLVLFSSSKFNRIGFFPTVRENSLLIFCSLLAVCYWAENRNDHISRISILLKMLIEKLNKKRPINTKRHRQKESQKQSQSVHSIWYCHGFVVVCVNWNRATVYTIRYGP